MLARLARQSARSLYRQWAGPDPHARPEGKLFRTLSRIWRTSRHWHHWLFRPQPRVLLCMDGIPRLTGCGSLTGWVLGRDEPVQWVEAWINGKLVARAQPDHCRPDVLLHFRNYKTKNPPGFRLCPPNEIVAAITREIEIRAVMEDGSYTKICSPLVVDGFMIQDDPRLPSDWSGSQREYALWLRRHDHHDLPSLSRGPRFTIVMPVFRPNKTYLREAVLSLLAQTYSRWELCIHDDGNDDPELTRQLRAWTCADTRLRFSSSLTNEGISRATNHALQQASGEYVGFLDQDDRLHPQALQAVAHSLSSDHADLLFTDEDRLDEQGGRVEPFFKPGWSLELLHACMYLGHFCVYSRAVLDKVGYCDSRFDGTQDWELALRVASTAGTRIRHLPGVFYHWRLGGYSSTSAGNQSCHERGKLAVQESLARQKLPAEVNAGPRPCAFHTKPVITDLRRKISILIPTRDRPGLLRTCLDSLRRRTGYEPLEIIVVDNGSTTRAARRYLQSCPADRIIPLAGVFNHSKFNNVAAEIAQGELLLLLNDDTQALYPDWLEQMAAWAVQPHVGAVGAWLVYPDGRTQHNGILLCPERIARPINSHLTRDGLDRGMGTFTRQVSAVTGACLLIRKELYFQVGGLDADMLPTSFNDVDLCLRLRRAGYLVLQCPQAKLIHQESASRRITEDEDLFRARMRERWSEELRGEAFWNPLLSRASDADRGLALAWRNIPEQSSEVPEHGVGACELHARDAALNHFAA